jgi:hypothetical protein
MRSSFGNFDVLFLKKNSSLNAPPPRATLVVRPMEWRNSSPASKNRTGSTGKLSNWARELDRRPIRPARSSQIERRTPPMDLALAALGRIARNEQHQARSCFISRWVPSKKQSWDQLRLLTELSPPISQQERNSPFDWYICSASTGQESIRKNKESISANSGKLWDNSAGNRVLKISLYRNCSSRISARIF